MPENGTRDPAEAAREEYEQGQRAAALARMCQDQRSSNEPVKNLVMTLDRLADLGRERVAIQPQGLVPGLAPGRIIDTTAARDGTKPREGDTDDLEVWAELRMAAVPTGVYHVFTRDTHSLVDFTIRNTGKGRRRLRVTSFIEGYSARAIDTVELDPSDPEDPPFTLSQLPTLFPHLVAGVGELTKASLDVTVEDLDRNGTAELHRSVPVKLLARTYVPMSMVDPVTGARHDLSRYLGAFVTPNSPAVLEFLRRVADQHELGRLAGYDSEDPQDSVESQVRAVFKALRADGTTYVNSVVAFNPEDPEGGQRVRLPRESLQSTEANCIDATLLVASLLEAMSLKAAIVLIPGHALVGWQPKRDEPEWIYLETTMIGGQSTFEEAVEVAGDKVDLWQPLAHEDPPKFRHMPIETLRTVYGITPLE